MSYPNTHKVVRRYQWCAGWNNPGYLPDSEPMDCETWEGARDALLFELERYDTEDETEMGEIDSAIAFFSAKAQADRACEIKVGNYVYWIVTAETPFED